MQSKDRARAARDGRQTKINESERLRKLQETADYISKGLLALEVVVIIIGLLFVFGCLYKVSVLEVLGFDMDALTSFAAKVAQGDPHGTDLWTKIIGASASVAGTILEVGIFDYMRVTFREMASGTSPFNDKTAKRLRVIATFALMLLVASTQDIALLAMGLVIYLCFDRLFAYGCALQELSDETL